jgi:beta-lactam-binding protein with PASTA domain
MTQTVGGRYELGDPLGRGGMAEVRRAVDLRLGRAVAVKQLRPDLATDPTFQARFRREAQSAAGLNHPTIVAVYDTGEEPDPTTGVSIPYIVMELVEGPTLRDVLRDGRRILPERALELTAGVLDALGYSHRAGIIHRDIKPANVMLTTNGTVKVMDFGIARAVADTSATMTQTAAVIGTAQYLSPEQARGETVDARSDLYSTGCLLYELLTGRPPFTGDSPVSVAYQHVREAPVPPSQIDPEIGPDIDAVVLKSLAKDPADRYQSAREMKADINRVLAGQQATAVVPRVAAVAAPVAVAADLPTRVVPPVTTSVVETTTTEDEDEPKKRTGLVVLVSLLVLALVAGGVFAWYRLTNPAVQDVAVPDVLTYTESQARSQIEGAGFRLRVERDDGDAATKGTVVAQDPAGRSQAPSGSTVTITVNDGPESADIPAGLVGEDVDDVEKTLRDAGFTNVDTEEATSEDADAKEGEVLSVSPDEGSSTPLADQVTVTYATGRSAVPDVEGFPQAAAEKALRDAGFTKVSTSRQVSSQPTGTVVSQSPDAGSKVARSTTVKLVVATAAAAPTPTAPPTTSEPEPSPTPEPTATATDGSGEGDGDGGDDGNGDGNGNGGGNNGNGNGNGGANGGGNGGGNGNGNNGNGNGNNG